MKKYSASISAALIAGLLFPVPSEGNDGTPLKEMTVSQAEVILPRMPLRPVKSLITTDAGVVDTLETSLDYVKIVLYADNTWKYVKDPGHLMSSEVFEDHWDTVSMNPYRMPLDSLPKSWGVWIADSLSHYHCPYLGEVNIRGKFGIRRGRRHQGVDIPLKTGDPVYAAFDGRVRVSRYVSGYGNLMIVRHLNGLETFYGHLSSRNFNAGDWVNAGDVIGKGGSTGRSTGPHLHFETRYKGFAFDPQWLIDFESGDLRHRLFLLKRQYFSPYSSYEQDFEDEILNADEDRKEDEELAARRYYTIKSGDTLGRIAINYGTTVSALCRLNGISANTVLKIGRKIRVR